MKKPSLLILLLICTVLQAGDRRLVRIHLEDPQEIRRLQAMGLDLASRRSGVDADAVLSPAEEAALAAEGFRLEPLTAPAALARTAAALTGDMGAYHTWQELGEELAALAESYPRIMRLTSIGRSVEGREIWAVKLSDHPDLEEEDEAEVLLTAAIHAREIITPEILLDLIHHLTTLYGSDSLLTRLVDERQIWLVPMLNPDGHVRVENGDIWWRKNCRPNADGSTGVDLNRNFGYMWGYDDYGSSPRPVSETYRGSAPFSEPETAALRDFAAAHRFAAVVNYHSYARAVLLPWGYIYGNTPHHQVFLELGRSLSAASGYEYGNWAMGLLYGTNGDADDYFYGASREAHPCFSVTIEVGTSFHPPEEEMSQLIAENRPASLYIAYIADKLARNPWLIVPADSAGSALTTAVAAADEPEQQPKAFALLRSYPNPFNAATTISFTLTEAAAIRIALLDALGRPLRTLRQGFYQAGEHRLRLDAGGLPSGLYFCRLESSVSFAQADAAAAGGRGAPASTQAGPRQSALLRILLLR